MHKAVSALFLKDLPCLRGQLEVHEKIRLSIPIFYILKNSQEINCCFFYWNMFGYAIFRIEVISSACPYS